MQKCICFVLAVLLVFSLCACAQQDQPQIDAPPQTDPPTDPPTEPPTAPATEPPDEFATMPPTEPSEDSPSEPSQGEGMYEIPPGAYVESDYIAFMYNEKNLDPILYDGFDLSACQKFSFYYTNKKTKQVTHITDEQVHIYANNCTHVFYVKNSEPNKIYAAPFGNVAASEVIYEMEAGKITALEMGPFQYQNTALQIVEDNKRLVWLDLLTDESQVLMEQNYLKTAKVIHQPMQSERESNLVKLDEGIYYLLDLNIIQFTGKLSNEQEFEDLYWYFRDTEELIKVETCSS